MAACALHVFTELVVHLRALMQLVDKFDVDHYCRRGGGGGLWVIAGQVRYRVVTFKNLLSQIQ